MASVDNRQLKDLYEKVYREGKEKFFTFPTADVSEQVLSELYRTDALGQHEATAGRYYREPEQLGRELLQPIK